MSTRAWGTRTAPSGSSSSSRGRWGGRGWSRTEGSHTTWAAHFHRLVSASSDMEYSVSIIHVHISFQGMMSYSQDVHDDPQGPDITGLVVLLRAQHLRGCRELMDSENKMSRSYQHSKVCSTASSGSQSCGTPWQIQSQSVSIRHFYLKLMCISLVISNYTIILLFSAGISWSFMFLTNL